MDAHTFPAWGVPTRDTETVKALFRDKQVAIRAVHSNFVV